MVTRSFSIKLTPSQVANHYLTHELNGKPHILDKVLTIDGHLAKEEGKKFFQTLVSLCSNKYKKTINVQFDDRDYKVSKIIDFFKENLAFLDLEDLYFFLQKQIKDQAHIDRFHQDKQVGIRKISEFLPEEYVNMKIYDGPSLLHMRRIISLIERERK